MPINKSLLSTQFDRGLVNAIAQIIVSALLRLISLVAFYKLPFPIIGSTWISDFFLPASLMIFFAFLGSLWPVIGITIGSFMYIALYRGLPWDIVITTSLPSSFALLFTMLYLFTSSHELLYQPLAARLTLARIMLVSVVYGFWNSLFYFFAFLCHADYFQAFVSFDYWSLLHLFIGDVFGGVAVLGTLKSLAYILGARPIRRRIN